MTLHVSQLPQLRAGSDGKAHIPCPICSTRRKPGNRQKPVCAVWVADGKPSGYNCVHCGAHGPVIYDTDHYRHRPRRAMPAPQRLAPADSKVKSALAIWRASKPLSGTLGEVYLRDARGIRIADWPDDLRFHGACPREGETPPAIVALMRDIHTNEPTGIHRTFLRHDGRGKDAGADGDKAKMMLGRAKGAVVKLTSDDAMGTGLAIAEGIETAMSCLAIGWPMWACLSAGGIEAFPVLRGVEELTILADHDRSGTGVQAAFVCRERWINAGAKVRVLRPKIPGQDFNDALRVA